MADLVTDAVMHPEHIGEWLPSEFRSVRAQARGWAQMHLCGQKHHCLMYGLPLDGTDTLIVRCGNACHGQPSHRARCVKAVWPLGQHPQTLCGTRGIWRVFDQAAVQGVSRSCKLSGQTS